MRVIGSISGTSVDGIDAVLVEISGTEYDLKVEPIAAATYTYPEALRTQILGVCAGEALSMEQLAELDDAIAREFARAAIAIQGDRKPAELIGSHGQTVYHRPPDGRLGYSLQLGRGAAIANLTGIPTASNFRAADIAAGGQGAPLVPKIDVCLFSHPQRDRCVQNIGGIGNLTYLPAIDPDAPISRSQYLAWDTGPGNSLLDLAVQQLSNGEKSYDRDGEWASSGTINSPLVDRWLQHPFFHQPPPKSTGRELFGWKYFQQCLAEAENLDPADLLATLTELTAASIANNYRDFLPAPPAEVLLCGGGSRNSYLRQRLHQRLQENFARPVTVLTTDEVGFNADFKEAIAFAVLAYWRYRGIPGNLPSCTGAKCETLLGEIWLPMG